MSRRRTRRRMERRLAPPAAMPAAPAAASWTCCCTPAAAQQPLELLPLPPVPLLRSPPALPAAALPLRTPWCLREAAAVRQPLLSSWAARHPSAAAGRGCPWPRASAWLSSRGRGVLRGRPGSGRHHHRPAWHAPHQDCPTDPCQCSWRSRRPPSSRPSSSGSRSSRGSHLRRSCLPSWAACPPPRWSHPQCMAAQTAGRACGLCATPAAASSTARRWRCWPCGAHT